MDNIQNKQYRASVRPTKDSEGEEKKGPTNSASSLDKDVVKHMDDTPEDDNKDRPTNSATNLGL